MAEHTPGPWVKRWDDRVTTPDDTDGSKSIAHCYSHIHDCEANARLIAAAPDLLESAIRMTTMDHGGPLHVGRCATVEGGKCDCGLVDMLAAIAKATGSNNP